ncbi:MAG: aminoacyl-tRNA hydrolase [Clostridia bacterium]|nr:aminoacyl-tRNA hydrolase [Clostridia bacterium]
MADIFDLFKKIETPRADAAPVTHIIAGLGNPDEKYRFTRHNAGFLAVEYISQKTGFAVNRSKFKSLVADVTFGGKRCLFMMPQTYMNNSGEALREAAEFYKIPAENILVIYDDISLDVGVMRIRRKGSDGGHNGIKSIIYHLQSDNFPRIKVGIGKKPHPEMDLADWVLGSFSAADKEKLFALFENVKDAAQMITDGKIDAAMNKFSK